MRLQSVRVDTRSRFWSHEAMRDELSHALVEALYELDVLPRNEDGALLGLYAIMDDLREAMRRTERLDPARRPRRESA